MIGDVFPSPLQQDGPRLAKGSGARGLAWKKHEVLGFVGILG